jgi:two-component system KDP operon response regulator KdpE
MAELEARIRAVLRHRRAAPDDRAPEAMTVGPLSLDTVQHAAHLHGSPLELTSKEFDVLSFLAAHAGKVCTHKMILTAVWGNSYTNEAQYLHAYVHRLRQKLGEQSGLELKTAPGIGYLLSAEPYVP